MKKIVVTGHGQFATGIKSTVELLAGDNQDLYFVDFIAGESDLDLKQKFERILEENDGNDILFFCDLIGGTPFKTAASLAYDNERIEVVAGCNVGALLDAIFTKETEDLASLARRVVSVSQNATGVFEKRKTVETEAVETDGI